jgi:glycosyltransferase involved in cell wall biosynthesis
MITVGSDVSVQERKTSCTGIERVVREVHEDLRDLLWPEGLDLVPFRLRRDGRSTDFLTDPYLASDPVLARELHDKDALDVMLFLDLDHMRDFSTLFRMRQARHIPTVFVIYDLLPLLSPQWFPTQHDRLFRLYLQQVMRTADHIVTISEKVASDIQSLGWRTTAKIHPCRLGSTFGPLTPPDVDHLSILYVSTLEPRKGHDVLLDAFDLLLATGADAELTLVGRQGWECSATVARIASHPALGTRLHWHEGASDHEVRQLSRRCNVAVMPSRDEGFGLFIEEAMSLGLKVVASDIPVFHERRAPNLTLSDLTPAALAGALMTAYEAPVTRTPVRRMRDFSLDLLELITSITKGSAPA